MDKFKARKAPISAQEINIACAAKPESRRRVTGVLFSILLLMTVGLGACTGSSDGPLKGVTIGISATSLLPSLIHIADETGIFRDEGIEVEIVGYPTGKAALDALFDGEVDMATVADTPIVSSSFNRDDFSIFATILDSSQHSKVLARRDRDISTIDDLVGKKVATTIGTTAHFFLATLLTLNGFDSSDIEIVNLKPAEMVDAIVNGDVDAIAAWEPNILKSQQLLGENGVLLPGRAGYEATFSLVSFNDFNKNNPELLVQVVTALLKAEVFLDSNKEESIDIMASRLETDRANIDSVWHDYRFRVSMSQSLLLTLDDVARWSILNNLTDKAEVPNFLNFLYLNALEEAKPEAVTIIR